MANASDLNYSDIDRPYDGNMDRSVSQVADLAIYDPTSDPYQNLDHTVDSGNFNDLWIANWIKSRNYQPKTQGFFLDGKTGYIEAQSIYIGNSETYISFSPSGGLEVVGAAYYTSKTGARLEIFPYEDRDVGLRVYDNSSNEVFRIMIGGSDIGDVFIGDVASGSYAQWDNSANEFKVEGGIITGGIVRTAASGVRIQMEGNDLSLYENTTSGVGDSATIKFYRVDNDWSGNYFAINQNTGVSSDSSNYLQIFPSGNAGGGGFNTIIIGANGNVDITDPAENFTDYVVLAAISSVTLSAAVVGLSPATGNNEFFVDSTGAVVRQNFIWLDSVGAGPTKYYPQAIEYKDHTGTNKTAIALVSVII